MKLQPKPILVLVFSCVCLVENLGLLIIFYHNNSNLFLPITGIIISVLFVMYNLFLMFQVERQRKFNKMEIMNLKIMLPVIIVLVGLSFFVIVSILYYPQNKNVGSNVSNAETKCVISPQVTNKKLKTVVEFFRSIKVGDSDFYTVSETFIRTKLETKHNVDTYYKKQENIKVFIEELCGTSMEDDAELQLLMTTSQNNILLVIIVVVVLNHTLFDDIKLGDIRYLSKRDNWATNLDGLDVTPPYFKYFILFHLFGESRFKTCYNQKTFSDDSVHFINVLLWNSNWNDSQINHDQWRYNDFASAFNRNLTRIEDISRAILKHRATLKRKLELIKQ